MCLSCVKQSANRQLIDRFLLDRRFEFLEAGSARAVFRHLGTRYVLKIALDKDAIGQNQAEHDYYHRYGKFGGRIPVARCKILKDPTFLVMEYIKPNYEALRRTGKISGDGYQGGLDSRGRLVHYDFGVPA